MNMQQAVADSGEGRDYARPAAAPSGRVGVELLPLDQALATPGLAAEWDALAQRASEANPFAERWYLDAAIAAASGADIRLAIVRDGGLLGLMPLI